MDNQLNPIAAESVREGMFVRKGMEGKVGKVEKVTEMADGKRLRFFFAHPPLGYIDVYRGAIVYALHDEEGKPTFAIAPDSVEQTNGVVSASWTFPPFAQDDKENLWEPERETTEAYEYERRVQELSAEVTANKKYIASLERLVLRHVSKEELLAMALGRG
jgi:hypothetical protein